MQPGIEQTMQEVNETLRKAGARWNALELAGNILCLRPDDHKALMIDMTTSLQACERRNTLIEEGEPWPADEGIRMGINALMQQINILKRNSSEYSWHINSWLWENGEEKTLSTIALCWLSSISDQSEANLLSSQYFESSAALECIGILSQTYPERVNNILNHLPNIIGRDAKAAIKIVQNMLPSVHNDCLASLCECCLKLGISEQSYIKHATLARPQEESVNLLPAKRRRGKLTRPIIQILRDARHPLLRLSNEAPANTAITPQMTEKSLTELANWCTENPNLQRVREQLNRIKVDAATDIRTLVRFCSLIPASHHLSNSQAIHNNKAHSAEIAMTTSMEDYPTPGATLARRLNHPTLAIEEWRELIASHQQCALGFEELHAIRLARRIAGYGLSVIHSESKLIPPDRLEKQAEIITHQISLAFEALRTPNRNLGWSTTGQINSNISQSLSSWNLGIAGEIMHSPTTAIDYTLRSLETEWLETFEKSYNNGNIIYQPDDPKVPNHLRSAMKRVLANPSRSPQIPHT